MAEQHSSIWPTVIDWGKGKALNTRQRELLQSWLQSNGQLEGWLSVAKPSDSSLDEAFTERGALLQRVVRQLEKGVIALPLAGDWTNWIDPLWRLWIPLALRIDAEARALNQPFVQGILGAQGTGKSTLSRILQLLLDCLDQRAVVLSIDDLYLTYAERCELQKSDPRLVWRGPPGTHDVALGIEVLTKICQGETVVALPRFDKSLHQGRGDRTTPLTVHTPTIVLFEGWFVGALPLPNSQLNSQLNSDTFTFPPPIETLADQQFAKDCNRRLRSYLPLWALLHSLVILRPKDYRWSLQWRQAAEERMIAAGKTGLSAAEIRDFVLYFWKALHPELFITPLTQRTKPSGGKDNQINYKPSLVINICRNHQVGSLHLSLGGHFKRV
ncbi:MAG: glycerate kinase [Cyanobacteria bacterium J06629_19]